jgi:stage IV sporulation protein B
LVKQVNKSNGENVKIKYIREGKEFETNLNPAKTDENQYKLGLWVRDAAAGVGTMTFYEPNNENFAALGRGILDVDTGKLINISKGDLVTSKIVDIKKGEDGNPGELRGTIENGTEVGEIYKNTYFGIYGKLKNKNALNLNENELIEVANRDEIKVGDAKLICSLDGETKKEYKVNIEKVYYNNNSNNKSMLVKITDDELIEKTGGIIQGMSGSPIVQDGKFIGCLTHVLVSNSKEGYAVFGDLMLKQMNN